MVELGRALAMEPKLLLLDEPVAGMNPSETESMARLIRTIRAEMKMTILLVEHRHAPGDGNFGLDLCFELW